MKMKNEYMTIQIDEMMTTCDNVDFNIIDQVYQVNFQRIPDSRFESIHHIVKNIF